MRGAWLALAIVWNSHSLAAPVGTTPDDLRLQFGRWGRFLRQSILSPQFWGTSNHLDTFTTWFEQDILSSVSPGAKYAEELEAELAQADGVMGLLIQVTLKSHMERLMLIVKPLRAFMAENVLYIPSCIRHSDPAIIQVARRWQVAHTRYFVESYKVRLIEIAIQLRDTTISNFQQGHLKSEYSFVSERKIEAEEQLLQLTSSDSGVTQMDSIPAGLSHPASFSYDAPIPGRFPSPPHGMGTIHSAGARLLRAGTPAFNAGLGYWRPIFPPYGTSPSPSASFSHWGGHGFIVPSDRAYSTRGRATTSTASPVRPSQDVQNSGAALLESSPPQEVIRSLL
ncbi:hypothetical protein SeLEV6574_g02865 [Synchytrium endobioticum]|uniref:Uncharacterized protein n=1 Tax=Synchytrium endobioticum TaxID=286115 RepID=A0A507D6C7_9FUNG|nr:hypothetical protein SeLEV6574_g02865 [Synchytrium endobioticum]